MLKVTVLCGGPSKERGISLNSARSVCDHLDREDIALSVIYFDPVSEPHLISRESLYSNTPSDFDFKLEHVGRALSMQDLQKELSETDIAFPLIHGAFGEDGELQSLLEEAGCPFTGSPSLACYKAFDKYEAYKNLKDTSFHTVPTLLVSAGQLDGKEKIAAFVRDNKLKNIVVKPARGGSSIGVHLATSAEDAAKACATIFDNHIDSRVVCEPFLKGKEFTVIILQDEGGNPVSLIPTEINLESTQEEIYDYRKKYLATKQVTFSCPPDFPDETITTIRRQAEELFAYFGFQDFARFDGWLLDSGEAYFADFNPISGMEQNSFLFIQGSQIGMSHQDMMLHILKSACRRQGLDWTPEAQAEKSQAGTPLQVIFGGTTAERHVSLMSGTNVWLKLRQSEKYEPKPYFLAKSGQVWQLPYSYALYHTTEEIEEICEGATERERRLQPLREEISKRLALDETTATEQEFQPTKQPLESFIQNASLVFIALHGGIGENGEIQRMLEEAGVPHTGSGSEASQICMNKKVTADILEPLHSEGIYSAKKVVLTPEEVSQLPVEDAWSSIIKELGCRESCVVKPIGDGCSAGVARLQNARDLKVYLEAVVSGAVRIPVGELSAEARMIEMPVSVPEELLFEDFIETDFVEVRGKDLFWKETCGWIEVTVGVIGAAGQIHAMNPSLTVAESGVLTLEEKFQGGTGINITPPPTPYVSEAAVQEARRRMELVANKLGINGFSRIDAFMKTENGELLVIEANTVPGLTPSTVIYHQALAEEPPMRPRAFLERILDFTI